MGLMDLPPQSVLLQESSVALLEQNNATPKCLILGMHAWMDLRLSISFLTLC